MRYVYPARLERDEAGFYLVTFPDIPEAGTDGRTPEEALGEAQDALLAALGGYVEAGRAIPIPQPVTGDLKPVYLPPLAAAKLALFSAMREEGASNVALAKRLGVSEAAVRRLVDPDHASRIEKVQTALEALGKHLIVEAA